MQLCELELKLAEYPRIAVGDLTKQPLLAVHLDHSYLTDLVKQFCGVIGKNGELIHDGDFVELNSPHYEVLIFSMTVPHHYYTQARSQAR